MNIYALVIECPQHQLDDTFYCLFELHNIVEDGGIYWEHAETYQDKDLALKEIDRVSAYFTKRGFHNKVPFEPSHFMDKDKIVGYLCSSSGV